MRSGLSPQQVKVWPGFMPWRHIIKVFRAVDGLLIARPAKQGVNTKQESDDLLPTDGGVQAEHPIVYPGHDSDSDRPPYFFIRPVTIRNVIKEVGTMLLRGCHLHFTATAILPWQRLFGMNRGHPQN